MPMGIRAPECDCPIYVMSIKDDRVAMKLMDESCYVKDQPFMVGIPWKYDPSVVRITMRLLSVGYFPWKGNCCKMNSKLRYTAVSSISTNRMAGVKP